MTCFNPGSCAVAFTVLASDVNSPDGVANDGVGVNATFNWIVGGAITSDGKTAYVCDEGNHSIRKVNLTTGHTSTVIGTPSRAEDRDGAGSNAAIQYPWAIVFDPTADPPESALLITGASRVSSCRVDLSTEPGTSALVRFGAVLRLTRADGQRELSICGCRLR